MNNDEDFVDTFVTALGNIYKYASRKAEYVFAGEEEDLISDQDLLEAEELLEQPDLDLGIRRLQAGDELADDILGDGDT